jgi:hypothetical protein
MGRSVVFPRISDDLSPSSHLAGEREDEDNICRQKREKRKKIEWNDELEKNWIGRKKLQAARN